MSQGEYRERCDKSDVTFKLLTGCKEAGVVEHVKVPPAAYAKSNILASPQNHMGSAPLELVADPCTRVCVISTEGARPITGRVSIEPDRQIGAPTRASSHA